MFTLICLMFILICLMFTLICLMFTLICLIFTVNCLMFITYCSKAQVFWLRGDEDLARPGLNISCSLEGAREEKSDVSFFKHILKKAREKMSDVSFSSNIFQKNNRRREVWYKFFFKHISLTINSEKKKVWRFFIHTFLWKA